MGDIYSKRRERAERPFSSGAGRTPNSGRRRPVERRSKRARVMVGTVIKGEKG